MSTFVEINAEQFKNFLSSKGFQEVNSSSKEIVYSFQHKYNKNLYVRVYTSIARGKASARDCGKDAIRVAAIFDDGNKQFGIGKFTRIHRTGSQQGVHERTFARMTDAYRRCNEWHRENLQSNHVGKLGSYFPAITVRAIAKHNANNKVVFEFTDPAGNQYSFWSTNTIFELGKEYKISGKIVAHKSFKNVKQTEIAEVAIW